jgi:replicative DNA helicase
MNALATPPSPRPFVPPHNYDAEQALLAALLANNGVYDRISDFLRPEHFYDALHARIYEAIGVLIRRGEIANPVTLKNQFDRDGALAEVGGAEYLVKLALAVVTVLNAEDYAHTIRDLWLRRRVIEIGALVQEDALLPSVDRRAEDVLETAEAMLAELAGGASADAGPLPMHGIVAAALAEIEAAWKRGTGGFSTGFASWNKLTGGLFPTDLIILAGRPGMGKTTLADNLIVNMAMGSQAGRAAGQVSGAVLFFSHEMAGTQIAKKMMARESGISAHRMRRGSIEGAWDAIAAAGETIGGLPIFVDDASALTAGQMLSRARRIQRRHGLALIVIDYLQLMRGEGRHDNRTQEVSAITRGLKAMAKQLDVPVVALSQLSRKLEDRDDKRPQLADLRESGSIEQDADMVMFVYREEPYLKAAEPRRRSNETREHFGERLQDWQEKVRAAENRSEIIVAKQRHGPIGSFNLVFDGAKDAFEDPDNNAWGGS